MAQEIGSLEGVKSLPEQETKEITQKEEERFEPYTEADWFEEVPVLRGFTEIKNLYEDLDRELGKDNFMLCGGYVRYMCSTNKSPSPAADIDIYFPEKRHLENFRNFLEVFMELEIEHENDVSVTFHKKKDIEHRYFATPQIQIIKPLKWGAMVTEGSFEDILNNFDFSVIRIGLIDPTKALADGDFKEDEKGKLLRIKNIHCPISSTMRFMKYAKKGYWARPFQIIRLFMDWQDRDEDYRLEILDYVQKLEGEGLTQDEVDRFEEMMKID